MRKIISIILLLIFTVCTLHTFAQSAIKFDKTIIDMGEFSVEDPIRTAVFEFTNTGDTPLVITNIRTGCGCTKANYSKEPIAPGQKGKITVEYNGAEKNPGYFNNALTVYNNTPDQLYRIFIKGNMLPKDDNKK